jgi:hypothetical protein
VAGSKTEWSQLPNSPLDGARDGLIRPVRRVIVDRSQLVILPASGVAELDDESVGLPPGIGASGTLEAADRLGAGEVGQSGGQGESVLAAGVQDHPVLSRVRSLRGKAGGDSEKNGADAWHRLTLSPAIGFPQATSEDRIRTRLFEDAFFLE